MAIGDRIVVMNKGQIVQLGSPLDIYKWPRTLWAAKFIGTYPVNALPVKSEGGRLIVPGAHPLDLGPVERLPGSALLSGTGTLAVRPESISIDEDHGDVAAPSARVVIRQVLGALILYDLELSTGATVRALEPSTSEFEPGETVRLSIDWKQVRLFGGADDALITPVASHEKKQGKAVA